MQAMMQDEKLNLTVFFRSHDMTQGWPENAYGCAAIQRYLADGMGAKPGLLIIMSGSAQIYANYYQQVEAMLAKYMPSLNGGFDRRGYFRVEESEGFIKATLVHPDSSTELESFSGRSAYEVMRKISSSVYSLDASHAMYLGSELAAAETALKQDKKYEQDRTFS
jgi:hypothetical protein